MNRCKKRDVLKGQKGGALIYILFIVTFVGIVLPVMLLTVTQGQRYLVAYEEQLVRDYLSEGALEVVMHQMKNYQYEEDENKAGIYYYLLDHLINKGLAEQVIPVQIDGVPLEVAVELVESNPTFLKAYLYDVANPHIKKILTIPVATEGGGSGGERPVFDRPTFPLPDGNYVLVETPQGDVRPLCLSQDDGSGVPTCSELTRNEGGFYVDGRLIVVGDFNFVHNDLPNFESVTFSGKLGVFMTAKISTNHYKKVKIYSEQGDIFIGDGADIDSSNELSIEAPSGHVVVENGALSTKNYTNIEINAGKYISLVDVNLQSSRNVHLNATNIYLEESQLNSTSNGTVELFGRESLWMEKVSLFSSNLVRVESQGWMNITDSILQSSAFGPILISSVGDLVVDGSIFDSRNRVDINSGGKVSAVASTMKSSSWTDIIIGSNNYLSIERANLQASRDILVSFISSLADMDVSDVSIQSRDNILRINQGGVQIMGKPKAGCVNNNGVLICP